MLVEHSLRRKRFSKKYLQKVIGKLNWCARVVSGGRTFMRNLINLMTQLKQPHHHSRLNAAAKADLRWWVTGLEFFHGHTPFTSDIALPSHQFSTDACLIGGGAMFRGDWFYVSWVNDIPEVQNCHINVLELETVLIAAERWGHLWSGSHILVRSDNTTTVAAINKGSSRSVELLLIIQKLFWLSVEHGFKLSASYLPGTMNVLSDRISRLHDPMAAVEAKELLTDVMVMEASSHMTFKTFLYLQECWGTS